MPDPLLSIVVPTLGRPEALESCLDSIEQTVAFAHEVLCVVVADDVETRSLLEGREAQTIVQRQRNGFVNAANLGFAAARGRYVTQINDDCIVLPYTMANAMRFLEAPAHSGVGQAAFFHDSPVRRNVHAQLSVEGTWYFVCHVRGLCYANFGLTRRSLGEELGWYDDRYFMYGADPDFSLKIWHMAKLAVAPCPGALVHHQQLEDDRGRAERSGQAEDNRKLFEKWNLT